VLPGSRLTTSRRSDAGVGVPVAVFIGAAVIVDDGTVVDDGSGVLLGLGVRDDVGGTSVGVGVGSAKVTGVE